MLDRRLKQFLVVADCGSISGASKRLHIAQPALSKAMQLLEEELAVRLFLRQPRGILLTDAGREIAEEAGKALASLEDAADKARSFQRGGRGVLTIGYGVFASMGDIPDLIVAFRKHSPSVEVRMRLLSTSEQLKGLENRQIDVGFAFTIACSPKICSQHISTQAPVLIMPADHPWAGRRRIAISELRNIPFILGNQQRWGPYREIVSGLCLSAGFLPNVVAEADDWPDMLAMLRMGEAFGLMGDSVLDQLPKSMKAVRLADPPIEFDISMIWNEDMLRKAGKRFVDFQLCQNAAK